MLSHDGYDGAHGYDDAHGYDVAHGYDDGAQKEARPCKVGYDDYDDYDHYDDYDAANSAAEPENAFTGAGDRLTPDRSYSKPSRLRRHVISAI